MAISGRFADVENGYALTLPENWLRLDSETGFVRFIDQAVLLHPALAEACQSSTERQQQACLDMKAQLARDLEEDFRTSVSGEAQLAWDLSTLDNPLPTMVVITPVTGLTGMTPELLLATGPDTLRARGISGRIKSGLVDLPAGTAAYFYYTVADTAWGANARAREFDLVAGDTLYSVTVVGHKSDDEMPAVADELLQSFEILGQTSD